MPLEEGRGDEAADVGMKNQDAVGRKHDTDLSLLPVLAFARELKMLSLQMCALTLLRERKISALPWWLSFPLMPQVMGLIVFPPNSHVEVVTPRTSEGDLIWS